MTCERLCGPQRQPCPTPYLCGTDCNFQCAETPHDKTARHFWEPDAPLHIDVYTGPSWFVRALDWVGNMVERLGTWPQFWTAIVLVLACAPTAVVGFSK